jgi:hypothetical protein
VETDREGDYVFIVGISKYATKEAQIAVGGIFFWWVVKNGLGESRCDSMSDY